MAAIDHRRHQVHTLTLDVRGGADQMIAQQIAAATNGSANHHFVENADDFFARWPAYVREMVWLSDGMFYDEACVMMSTLDLYRQLGVGVVLRGHGGELARMHEAYELRCNRHVRACRSQAALANQLFRQMNFALDDGDLARLFTPESAARMRGAARASLDEAFAGINPAWPLVDQVSCLYVQEYLRRQCVPSLALLRSRIDVRMPFLDQQYVAAVLALPPEARTTTRVHRGILARCNPALLRVTNANNGAPAGAGELRQRATRKALEWLHRYFGYEPYRHYVDVPGWLRGPLRPFIRETLLDERTLSRGLFSPDAVRTAVDEPRAAQGNWAEILLILTFVEIWHRLFVQRRILARRRICGAARPADAMKPTVEMDDRSDTSDTVRTSARVPAESPASRGNGATLATEKGGCALEHSSIGAFGVIIPSYNEPRLALVLERFDFAATPHVIIVDDGTTDGSIDVVKKYPVTLLRHERRSGVGAAIRTGLDHLKRNGFDVAVVMAGNNKDDSADIPVLLAALAAGADYVQGSRFIDRARSKATPLRRRLLTRLVALAWSVRFGRRLTEITNGFRAYRLSLLDDPAIDLSQDWLDRYELEYYLQYKVLACGYRYREVPVSKRYPNDGMSTSKIKLARDLWSLLRPIVLLTLRLAR